MRSRPKVKLLLSPGLVAPGDDLEAEAVLSATSETPVDFVALCLRGLVTVGVGSGKSRRVHEECFLEREWRSKAMTLSPGEHRFEARFHVPPGLPPSYVGADTRIAYSITVHVSIPWWPDRKKTFVVPVAFAPRPRPEPEPKVFVTSREGPRRTDPFVELSLDTTQISVGDEVSGSISLQNVRGKRIRGVDLSFCEMEVLSLPTSDTREARRFRLRVFDGEPAEGGAIPFRVQLPENATTSFTTRAVAIITEVEARADVAWGSDIVLRARVAVGPKATSPRTERGWVAPVGRERQMLVWKNVAERTGLGLEADTQRMFGRVGDVSVEILAERRDADYWLVANLGWPSLGLDLAVRERRWSDALAPETVKSGDARIDDRLAVRAREYAQAKVLAAPEVLEPLLQYDEVQLGDGGGTLAVRGASHVTAKVERFVRNVLEAASVLDATTRRVPPPILFAADLAAWEALAARLRGRLERGRMWIHGGQVGPSAVEIGSVWARSGLHLGSSVVVAIDPPLDHAPEHIDDPALSPAARDAWRALAAQARSVHVAADAITVELEGKLADPQTAMPVVELAVSLRRALGGLLAAGPFR